MKIVFSKDYTVKTPGHVFRADKFEAALKLLLREGLVSESDVAAPRLPTRADLLLAHGPAWVDKSLRGGFTAEDSRRAEIEISRGVVRAHLANVGGTVLAARLALAEGLAVNCGGGSHHAFRGHGEGFCLLNDIAVAVRLLLGERRVARAMVIDMDAHQGNGTASIFKGDRRVFTFSMHGAETYPEKKERSSLDLELKPKTGDLEYLALLRRELPPALDGGIRKRDAFVFAECRRRGVPVAVTLSGGYARKFTDTVRIHANTIREALRSKL